MLRSQILVIGVSALAMSCGGLTLEAPTDSGFSNDSGSGSSDAGSSDAGAADAGASDAGVSDAGATDAGAIDGGANDAGSTDAGASDGGANDAGVGHRPSGTLLFSTTKSNASGVTISHLSVATVEQGVVSGQTQLTNGDVVDQSPAFSLDGGEAIFVRESAGARNEPRSLRVITLAGGAERELATCGTTGGPLNDRPMCVNPVMGSDGYVYYGDEVRGTNKALSLKRVPFAGGAPTVVQTLDPTCFMRVSTTQDHTRILMTLWLCSTKGDSIISLPAGDIATVTMVAPADVVASSYAQLNVRGDALLLIGGVVTNSGVERSLYSYSASTPAVMSIATFGMTATPARFIVHDETTLMTPTGWFSLTTTPATKFSFTPTPDVGSFDWRAAP